MSNQIWSWVAAAASIIGLWVSGLNPRAGWCYGIGCQAVWVTYGWMTGQAGMIALSAAFVIIYFRNLRRWRGTTFTPRRTHTQPARQPDLARSLRADAA